MVIRARKINRGSHSDELAWGKADAVRLESWPWNKIGKYPDVEARLLWSDSRLHVRFHVKEDLILGRYTEYQSPVCRDSCVEFFVASGRSGYFNFEFSCIGTLLLMFGTCRNDLKPVPLELSKYINVSTSLPLGKSIPEPIRCPDTGYFVEYSVPYELFEEYSDAGRPKAGDIWRCNFYKCGDDLPVPHWGCWTPVNAPVPDFHRPEFFGEIMFEKGLAND